MNPRELAIAVALLLPLAGFLLERWRCRLLIGKFGDIEPEVTSLRTQLNAELDRDGTDLLIRGNYQQWPVLVRLSRSEQEPAVTIELPVSSPLTLFCYPAGYRGEVGRTFLSTTDQKLARFRLSTNDSAAQVNVLMASNVIGEMAKVCESQTSVKLEDKLLRVTEKVMYPQQLARRLMVSITALRNIAIAASGKERPTIIKKKFAWFRVAYISAAVVILLATVFPAVIEHLPKKTKEAEASSESISSAPAVRVDPEMAQVPQVQNWRVAETQDFNSDGVAWLQQQGGSASGHISASFSPNGEEDAAYVLKRRQEKSGENGARLVLFIDKRMRFDAVMPQIDVLSKISKDRINAVEWRGRPPASSPDGDGILVVQRYNDPSSAIIFFVSGLRLMSAVPKDFRTVSLD
jgi:hypothetical protein